ncbi:hypothetical protein L1887_37271 [Cichorium endivia]|nr:hypothetical protein L1887_37271 [Cichorium endivia]
MRQISHVESLSISVNCIAACFDPREDAPVSLPNLKTLELTVDGCNMNVLIPFLICLPDLESIHLIFPKHIYFVHKWKLDEAATMSILTRHLKKVEFRVFDEEKSKLGVARALLEHGNELEKMVFSWTIGERFLERAMETMKEVLTFHRASPTVKLKFIIDPSQADPRPAEDILDVEPIQVDS